MVSDNYFFRRVLIVADQLRELITRYGRPRSIQFDDGSEFLAEHFKILFVSCYSVFIPRHQRDEPGMLVLAQNRGYLPLPILEGRQASSDEISTVRT